MVNRLNTVVELGNWRVSRTLTVRQFAFSGGREAFEGIADITLELGEWIGGTWTPWAQAMAHGGHVSASSADALKGAATGALKRCAAMFGCGREAWEGALDDDNKPADDVKPAKAPQKSSKATPGQVLTVAKAMGLNPTKLRERIKAKFGVEVEKLNEDRAAELLGVLAKSVPKPSKPAPQVEAPKVMTNSAAANEAVHA